MFCHTCGGTRLAPARNGTPRGTCHCPPAETHRWVKFYVDGGVIGSNPSPRGVYWSMAVEGWRAPVRTRQMSEAYSTNNEAEWLAVREALRFAVAKKIQHPIVIYSDSKLIVNQFNGQFALNESRLRPMKDECRALAVTLKYVAVRTVPRATIVEKLGH